MLKGSRKPKVSQYKSETKLELDSRIAVVEATIARIDKLPGNLGSKWKVGMLRYYRRILTELEGYRNAATSTDHSSKHSV